MTELQKKALEIMEKEMERIGGTDASYDMQEVLEQLTPDYYIKKYEAETRQTIFGFICFVIVVSILCLTYVYTK